MILQNKCTYIRFLKHQDDLSEFFYISHITQKCIVLQIIPHISWLNDRIKGKVWFCQLPLTTINHINKQFYLPNGYHNMKKYSRNW